MLGVARRLEGLGVCDKPTYGAGLSVRALRQNEVYGPRSGRGVWGGAVGPTYSTSLGRAVAPLRALSSPRRA